MIALAVVLVLAAAAGFFAVDRLVSSDAHHEQAVDRARRAAALARPKPTDGWVRVTTPDGDLSLEMPGAVTHQHATVPDTTTNGTLAGTALLSGGQRTATCFEGDLTHVPETTSFDLAGAARGLVMARGMVVDDVSPEHSALGQAVAFSAHAASGGDLERGFLVISGHQLVVLAVVDPASGAADAEHVLLRMVGSLRSA